MCKIKIRSLVTEKEGGPNTGVELAVVSAARDLRGFWMLCGFRGPLWIAAWLWGVGLCLFIWALPPASGLEVPLAVVVIAGTRPSWGLHQGEDQFDDQGQPCHPKEDPQGHCVLVPQWVPPGGVHP